MQEVIIYFLGDDIPLKLWMTEAEYNDAETRQNAMDKACFCEYHQCAHKLSHWTSGRFQALQ